MSINSLKPPRRQGARFFKGIWNVFGRRRYARNTWDGTALSRIVMWWLFAAIGVLIFNYFPFKSIATIILLGMVSWGLTDAIRCANCAPGLAWMNLLLGTVGLVCHWHFGVAFFGHHFEFILLWGFVASGVLSIVRRVWNSVIWRLLDKSGYRGVV